MHKVLLIGLGICVVWAICATSTPAEEAIAPVDAAQQALDAPLSRTGSEQAKPEEPAAAKQAPLVGDAGDLKRLRVEGARSFKTHQIVAALLGNFEFQQAARPTADLAALLDTTEKLVREGYLYRGFLDAAVLVAYSGDADGMVLKVEEGPQYRTGKFRVEGAKLLPVEQLIARLQVPAQTATWTYRRGGETLLTVSGEDCKSPFWRADKPAPGDSLSLTHFQQGIEFALTELGFPFARFTVGFERVPGEQAADLMVTISDEGPEAVVSSLTFEGLTRHSEEEMRDFLKIEQGMKFSGAACEEAFTALRNSCRFWRYAVTVDCSTAPTDRYAIDPRTVDVRISVLEYELAPRLNEPLAETDEILVKAARWLESSWRATPGIELVIRRTSAAEAEGVDKFDCSIVINNQRGIVARVQGRGPFHPWDLNAGAIASNDQLSLFDWRSSSRIDYTGAVQPACALKISGIRLEGEDYKSTIKVSPNVQGGGRGTSGSMSFTGFSAVIEPVAMLDFSRGVGAHTTIEDGILKACDERGELQIEAATGHILKYLAYDGTLFEFKTGDDEFERLQGEIEEQGSALVDLTNGDWSLLSALQFLLGAAAEQPSVQRFPLGELLCRRGQRVFDAYNGDPLAKSLELALRNHISGEANTGAEFAIPQNLNSMAALNGITRFLVQSGPTLAEELAPRESWAWTWTREFCFAVAQSCEWAERKSSLTKVQWTQFVDEYWEQVTARETGPIGLWVLVALPARDLGPEGERRFAQQAYEQFDAASLDDDIKLFVMGDGALPQLTAAIVRACDGLEASERKQLRDSLGAPLGDLADLLFQRRDAHPDETPAEAVTAVVEAAWNAGLRAQVKDQLRQLAKLPEPPPTLQAGVTSEVSVETAPSVP
ncbi:hypothetical protein [Lacipirellula sp.]|uniref:hypothetical protein n=1 Tax=Lacipirellula sp. TaxID=2691419 RepID=UPI003D10CF13